MYEVRLRALRQGIAEHSCDAAISVHPATNQYYSGLLAEMFEISSAIIVTGKDAHLLTDSRYTEQAEAQVQAFEVSEVKGDKLTRAGERLTALGAKRALFDPDGLTVAEFEHLKMAFDGELVANGSVWSKGRLAKSPEEIAAIRAASDLAEGVMLDLVPALKQGTRERELAARFEYEFKARGAEGVSFDTIALFGPASSLPHGKPGDKTLEDGDIVLLDFGCRRSGYCSDLTRTYAFGSIPGAWFEEIYALTLQAQLAALAAIKPGVLGREVDQVARDIIRDGGYGDYFGHGLGHGVGIEIHEAPRLNPESATVLQPGMVVTVEPGIYLPGKGGVRIEDLVVVTDDGCEVMTQSSKELKVLSA